MADPAQSIIFVVDGKGLETQALLLAASIARHHDTQSAVRAVAYVSKVSQGNLDPATRALFEACGVEIAPLPDGTGRWKKDYPHGNKLLACSALRASQRTIFLDTDVVCQTDITRLPIEDPLEVFAVPEGKPTWGKDGDAWERAYRFFDLPLPEERVTLMRGRKLEYWPYFNAGFVSFSETPLEEDGRRFGQLWLEFASRFDWHCPVANKRPWTDQVTLPLVMAEYGLTCVTLPEIYNYSISDREDLSELPLAKLVHYHRAAYFNTMPHAGDMLDDVYQRTPARHHESLAQMLTHFTEAEPMDKVLDPEEVELARKRLA